MPDEANDLANHFEGVLDKEEGRSERPARRERREEEAVEQDELFPQRATEGEPNEDDADPEQQEVDDEGDEEEDRRRPQLDEEEDDRETALDLDQVVRVNVDGQAAEVSLQEALNGYVRAETFHRRLNQLGQVAQEIDKDRADLAEKRTYYTEMIPALMQQLQSL